MTGTRRLMCVCCLLGCSAMYAAAAGSGGATATVTVSKGESLLTLSLRGQSTQTEAGQTATFDYRDDLKIPLRLTLHLAALPPGFAKVGDEPALSLRFSGDQPGLAEAVAPYYDLKKGWDELAKNPTAPRAYALLEQRRNYALVAPYLEKEARGALAVSGNAIGDISLAADQAKWSIEVWEVQDPTKEVKLNLATLTVSWDLDVPFAVLNKKESQDRKDTLLVATVETRVPESAVATATKAADDATGTSIQEGTKVNPVGSAAGLFSFFTSGLGISEAAIAKADADLGYDVVAGYAVPNNGPETFVGFNASYEGKGSAPRWWPDKRLGLLAGRTTGGSEQFILAPSWKIGARAFLFGGMAFSDADGNTRDSGVFGISMRVGDLLSAASGNPSQAAQPTTPALSKVKVVIAKSASVAPEPASMSRTAAVLLIHTGEAPIARLGPLFGPSMTLPPGCAVAHRRLLYCAGAGDELTGAWYKRTGTGGEPEATVYTTAKAEPKRSREHVEGSVSIDGASASWGVPLEAGKLYVVRLGDPKSK